MDAIECIKTRMSIRKFKPEPVAKEVLMEVINIAKWSPSYKNSQPWQAVILSGDKKEALTKMLIQVLEDGTKPCPDLPEPKSWPAAEDASLTPWSLFDLGLFAQSLMLAAHANGLGSVPQAFATDYAQDVKKFLSIPETKRLVIGISIGYPDLESPVNAFRTDRVKTDEIVKWIE